MNRTFLFAPLALALASCSSQLAENQEEVDMLPGSYRIAISGGDIAEFLNSELRHEQEVCINNPAPYVATALARLNMFEKETGCGTASFEREGNRLTGRSTCVNPRGGEKLEAMTLLFDGVVAEEELTGTLGFEAQVDDSEMTAQEKVILSLLQKLKAQVSAERTGPC